MEIWGKLNFLFKKKNVADFFICCSYGYQNNGYHYDRPKFMFYPYSQKDIPKDAPGYHIVDKDSVTIEPSYSYELKPQVYEVPNETPQIDLPHHGSYYQQPEQPQQQQQQYEEPVIVLKIPGPAKYASHLQSLLQQYLEIRAAQYLRILEEAEARKQQQAQEQYEHHHHHHHQQQEEPQTVQQPQTEYQAPQQYEHAVPTPSDYATPSNQAAAHHHVTTPQQYEQVEYVNQNTVTPAPVSYPDIHDVYQGYKGRHRYQQHTQIQQPQAVYYHHQEQSYEPASAVAGPSAAQQYYYPQQTAQHHKQQYVESTGPEDNSAYQHVYVIQMVPDNQYDSPQQHQSQPIYVPEDEQQQNHYAHSEPQINENNPRTTHTKVIFNEQHAAAASDQSNDYPLPSIRPYERHAPTSVPVYHQSYQHSSAVAAAEEPHELSTVEQPTEQNIHYQDVGSVTASSAESSHQETVAITQRPFNYHAHALRKAHRGRSRKRGVTTAAEADKQIENIRDYVRDKLGAKMGSALEFKTTQLVKTN